MFHASVNFDRKGVQEDINVVCPIQQLAELAAMRNIGTVGSFHYSFVRQFTGMLWATRLEFSRTQGRAFPGRRARLLQNMGSFSRHPPALGRGARALVHVPRWWCLSVALPLAQQRGYSVR